MNKYFAVVILWGILAFPACLWGEEGLNPAGKNSGREKSRIWERVSGKIGLMMKYDSNLDLTDGKYGGKEKNDLVTEFAGQVGLTKTWAEKWHLETEIQGLADLPAEYKEDRWYLGSGNLYFEYRFGKNSLSFFDDANYVVGPNKKRMYLNDSAGNPMRMMEGLIGPEQYSSLAGFDLLKNDLDFFRNSASLSYQRELSSLWQARAGYENLITHYPSESYYDYSLHGWFLEVRNTWNLELSTFYRYEFQFSSEGSDSAGVNVFGSPSGGYRHMADLGIDWFFTDRDSLNCIYTFQIDDGSGQSIDEYSERGEQSWLDEGQKDFTYLKNKLSLLYLHRFSRNWTVSFYGESMYRTFSQSGFSFPSWERDDFFLLFSTWLKVRIVRELFGQFSYIYRRNDSSLPVEEFQNHIIQIGTEYRF